MFTELSHSVQGLYMLGCEPCPNGPQAGYSSFLPKPRPSALSGHVDGEKPLVRQGFQRMAGDFTLALSKDFLS